MKMYLVKASWQSNFIQEVEVEKLTPNGVYFKGRRSAMSSEYQSFFRTMSEAVAFVIAREGVKVKNALNAYNRALENEKDVLEKLKKIQNND